MRATRILQGTLVGSRGIHAKPYLAKLTKELQVHVGLATMESAHVTRLNATQLPIVWSLDGLKPAGAIGSATTISVMRFAMLPSVVMDSVSLRKAKLCRHVQLTVAIQMPTALRAASAISMRGPARLLATVK